MTEPISAIAARSIAISATATLLASSWSLPLAYVLARRGGGLTVSILEALVGVPTVLVGLLLYMLLSSRGPLGFLHLLYTPTAIVLGESLLVTPLISASAYRILQPIVGDVMLLTRVYGGGRRAEVALALREAAPALAGAVAMGFSRAIGELGVALIVGGNIAGLTRTLSTSIALATAMGEYEAAIRLGAVLAGLSIGFSLAVRAGVDRWGQG